jgi:hypothetical protein
MHNKEIKGLFNDEIIKGWKGLHIIWCPFPLFHSVLLASYVANIFSNDSIIFIVTNKFLAPSSEV